MSINYDTLRKLQDVLAQVFIVEDKIKDIPRDLYDGEAVLQQIKIDYLDLSAKRDQIKQELDELNVKYANAVKEREERESSMVQATLVRESESTEKAINEARTAEQTLFKSRNAKQKYLTELEEKLEVQAEIVKAKEEEVAEDRQQKDALIAEQQKILDELLKQKEELSQNLPANLIFKFERIIRNKGGVGVVPLHGIICQGCFMELPQQFANTVRRNEDINFCPYCSRILFYEESEEDSNEAVVHGDVHDEEMDDEIGGGDDVGVVDSDDNLFE
jgi:hypothetical protein